MSDGARWRRSLGAKLVLLLTAVGVAGALGITVLLAAIIMPSLDGLEEKAADGQVERTRAALASFARRVERAALDHGDRFALQDPTIWIESPAESDAMADLGVEGMAYADPAGRVSIARWIGEAGQASVPMRDALIAEVDRIDPARRVAGRRAARFYARVGDAVAAIGVAPVRRADGSVRGYVVMARTISPARLSTLLQVPTRIERATADTEVITTSPRVMAIAVPIVGADGHAVAAVRFGVPRDVSLFGRRMLLLAVAGSIALLLVILLVLRTAIARMVLAPLARIEAHMQRVRASGSLSLLQDEGRRDEVGALGRAFNAMLRQLDALRGQIEVQSFALGRSESAVAVMHNVRNALNPVSTILSHGITQGPPIDRSMLDRALAELARDDVAPVRRVRLAAFVATALDAEAAARHAVRSELEVGREAMAHVLEIIGQQQRQAHERPALERCDVTDIVARNAAIARHAPMASIAFSFPAEPVAVIASRMILSQVIGNLFANAAEAIAARGDGSGAITVTIAPVAGRMVVTIQDDGEGFAPDHAPDLFRRGYSTRAHKSGGLGLHWCANATAAMGGTLELRSAGEGLGAEAILTLAAADQNLAAAA